MLPKSLRVISRVSEMKSMTFGLPKTVSNVFISHLACLHDIYIFSLRKKTKNLCYFVYFPRYWEKITRCRMRTLGTVLESSDIIFFSCRKFFFYHKNSSRRTPRHPVQWNILVFRAHSAALCVKFTHSASWKSRFFNELNDEEFFGMSSYDKNFFYNWKVWYQSFPKRCRVSLYDIW